MGDSDGSLRPVTGIRNVGTGSISYMVPTRPAPGDWRPSDHPRPDVGTRPQSSRMQNGPLLGVEARRRDPLARADVVNDREGGERDHRECARRQGDQRR